jgi:hypothetical protein
VNNKTTRGSTSIHIHDLGVVERNKNNIGITIGTAWGSGEIGLFIAASPENRDRLAEALHEMDFCLVETAIDDCLSKREDAQRMTEHEADLLTDDDSPALGVAVERMMASVEGGEQ